MWAGILTISTGHSPARYIGNCEVFIFVEVFGYGYKFIGSFWIAFFRVMFLKATSNLMGNLRAQMMVSILITTLSVIMTLVITILYLFPKPQQSFLIDLCCGHSPEFLAVVHDYSADPSSAPPIHKSLFKFLLCSPNLRLDTLH